jgi:hypothetical protein
MYCSGCWQYMRRHDGQIPVRKKCLGCGRLLQQRTADRSDHCGKCAEGLPCEALYPNGNKCLGVRGRSSGRYCYTHHRDVLAGRPFSQFIHRGGKQGCFKHKNPMPCALCAKDVTVAKYGITAEQYFEMLEAQGGVCAFPGCNLSESSSDGRGLAVDHCHTTGQVRSLLCGRHNLLLGYAMDDIAELTHAIEYLVSHGVTKVVPVAL